MTFGLKCRNCPVKLGPFQATPGFLELFSNQITPAMVWAGTQCPDCKKFGYMMFFYGEQECVITRPPSQPRLVYNANT